MWMNITALEAARSTREHVAAAVLDSSPSPAKAITTVLPDPSTFMTTSWKSIWKGTMIGAAILLFVFIVVAFILAIKLKAKWKKDLEALRSECDDEIKAIKLQADEFIAKQLDAMTQEKNAMLRKLASAGIVMPKPSSDSAYSGSRSPASRMQRRQSRAADAYRRVIHAPSSDEEEEFDEFEEEEEEEGEEEKGAARGRASRR